MTVLPHFFDANVFFASLPIGSGTKTDVYLQNILCFSSLLVPKTTLEPAIAGVLNMAIIRNVL